MQLVEPSFLSSSAMTLCSGNPPCTQIQSVIEGTAHCRQFVRRLVTGICSESVFCGRCDAGLTTICIPLQIGRETLGYLLTGSYRVDSADRTAPGLIDNSLEPAQRGDAYNLIAAFTRKPPVVDEAQHKAFIRWLQLAIGTLLKSLHLKDDTMERPLPKFIIHICSTIQQCYKDPPTLGKAAETCSLSKGYFCRAFHEFTGLRFVEYIHAVRIEKVCELLLDPSVSVADAAFAVGFNSLSQFNRVFRKLKGTTPRQWRKTA